MKFKTKLFLILLLGVVIICVAYFIYTYQYTPCSPEIMMEHIFSSSENYSNTQIENMIRVFKENGVCGW